jgi:hypothetical protein
VHNAEKQEGSLMNTLPPQGRRRFDLPPDAEKYLAWYGFLKRLPTTIFWLSLGYVVGFAALTILLGMIHAAPSGMWLGLYVLGGMLFVVALYLVFAGWIRRRMG